MPGFRVDHEGVRHHFRMNVPVGHHLFANDIQAVFKIGSRPSGEPLIDSSHARRIRHDAILAFDVSFTAPVSKLADEIIGNLTRKLAPVLEIAVWKDLSKLRDGKMSKVYQTRRIINDEAHRNPRLRIDNPDTIRWRGRAVARRR